MRRRRGETGSRALLEASRGAQTARDRLRGAGHRGDRARPDVLRRAHTVTSEGLRASVADRLPAEVMGEEQGTPRLESKSGCDEPSAAAGTRSWRPADACLQGRRADAEAPSPWTTSRETGLLPRCPL